MDNKRNPSSNQILLVILEKQNKRPLFQMERNLILANILREFIDQLKVTQEIGIDSQLMNQVIWRKKLLIQVYGEVWEKRVVVKTLEDILIDQKQQSLFQSSLVLQLISIYGSALAHTWVRIVLYRDEFQVGKQNDERNSANAGLRYVSLWQSFLKNKEREKISVLDHISQQE